MTTKLSEFEKSCNMHEKLLAEELRIYHENYKRCQCSHAQGENCECECHEEHHYSPSKAGTQRIVHKSAAPTVYAYGRQKAIYQAQGGELAEKMICRICGEEEKQCTHRPTENVEECKREAPKNAHYNQRFHPTKQFIYTPNCETKAPINMTKAMLGQTTFVPSLYNATETVWRQNFLKTQTMNDQEGNRAEHGLQPIQNVYVTTGQDGYEFTVDFKGKPKDLSHSVGGYVYKHIGREASTHEPREAFVATIRAQSFEKSPGIRPYYNGNAYTRNIKTEDLGVERLCKELKFDTRTTNRQAHGEIDEEMQIIAHNEQVRAHKRYIADRNKPSPVGNGFPAQMLTTYQYFSKHVEEHQQYNKFEEDYRLKEKCVQRAKEMFGSEEQEARDWVETLSLEKYKQLAFLGDEAVRREQNPLFYQTKQ